jgi:type I restriction enzyme, S subunit
MTHSWTKTNLGAVAAWTSGGTPSKARQSYWTGTVPWVSPKDMKRFSLADTEDHISDEAVREGARLVPAGTAFIVVRGMILAHTFPISIAGRAMSFNQDVKAVAPLPGTNGRFLAHFLHGNADRLLRLVTEATHGTKRIELRDLVASAISLPPLSEQRRIAEILDSLDEAILKTEELIAKLKGVKQGLLHDVLTRGIDENGELRDPVRHPKLFAYDSESGRIPKAWVVRPFAELCESSAFGPRFPSDRYAADGPVATLRTTDMDDEGRIEVTTMPRAAINPLEFGPHLLRRDDLVISRSGTCGIAGVFPGHPLPVVPGAFLIRFRLKDPRAAHFYQRYFNSSLGRPRLERLAVGGVQKNIKGSDVLSLRVPWPGTEEGSKVVAVVTAAEEQIESAFRELSKLRLLKHGLTDDLLSGRVRVTKVASDEAA